MLYLRFNRRLLWTVLGALAWAYLGIAATLPPGPPPRAGTNRAGHQDGDGGRFGLHLRLPPGSLMLPGKLTDVHEDEAGVHIPPETPHGPPPPAGGIGRGAR